MDRLSVCCEGVFLSSPFARARKIFNFISSRICACPCVGVWVLMSFECVEVGLWSVDDVCSFSLKPEN